jgi:hypothetical protein
MLHTLNSISTNELYFLWTANFKYKYYLRNLVNGESLAIGWLLPKETNSPPVEVEGYSRNMLHTLNSISTIYSWHYILCYRGVMVFNATFNNISFISWRSVFSSLNARWYLWMWWCCYCDITFLLRVKYQFLFHRHLCYECLSPLKIWVRIPCPSWVTCLSADCCFSELAL